MNPEPSILSLSLRALFSLIAVIGLMYFFVYFLFKFSRRKGRFSADKNSLIEIVGKLNLSPKKAIYLVKIGKKILVIGANGEIHLLCTIEDEEFLKLLEFQPDSSRTKFTNFLKSAFFSGGEKISGLLLFNRVDRVDEK